MHSRNALTLLAAIGSLALAATGAAAQQTSSAAKPQKATATAAATVHISADSARRIVMQNLPGATVRSERLRTKGSQRYYVFTLRPQGQKANVRATVDASTGAFARLDQPTKTRTSQRKQPASTSAASAAPQPAKKP